MDFDLANKHKKEAGMVLCFKYLELEYFAFFFNERSNIVLRLYLVYIQLYKGMVYFDTEESLDVFFEIVCQKKYACKSYWMMV